MRSLLLILTTLLITSSAFARKPAVEDFVGVESESYSTTTPGSEVLFNFNNNMNEQASATSGSKIFTYLFIISFVSLPFFMWIGLTRSQKEEKSNATSTVKFTTLEQVSDKLEADNVEYLSDYKDDIKKAS